MSIFDIGQERIDKVVWEYSTNKMSMKDIADKYNLLHIVVMRVLHKKNIRYHKSKVNPEYYNDIVKAYTEDLIPTIEIGKRYNMQARSVLRILNKCGIDTSKAVAANITTTCSQCGKVFSKKRCLYRKSLNHYCGNECYHAALESNYIRSPKGCYRARKIVSKYITLEPGNVIHHEDGNDKNNDIKNLRAFANNGDHVRYHRGFRVPVIFDGSHVK